MCTNEKLNESQRKYSKSFGNNKQIIIGICSVNGIIIIIKINVMITPET